MSIRTRRRGQNFFITGSNVSGLVNATTVSSSIFAKMSQSFADGEHLIDDAQRENQGAILFMLQELQDDVDDIYTQVSASQYAPLDNSKLQATTGSYTILNLGGTKITSTATELNIMDGNTAASFITPVDADRVVLNDGGTMRQVSLSTLAGYFDDEITNMPNLANVGTDLTVAGHITASGNISASGEYIGNQIQIYQANFTDDISTTTHFVPLGTSTFENTTEDVAHVGLVAPYDGELVKIIYRHSFDASSTTTRWVLSVIPDGTDMAGSPTTRFRGTVTGATADTIQEVTVADADSTSLDDMFFNKGESIFISLRNASDVTTSVTTDDFHVTVVLKFNVPLGLI